MVQTVLAFPVLAGGYQKAKPNYPWSFGRDHGAHPDYQNEWWYYTGHLKDTQGGRFGFQLTFFRVGVPKGGDNPSSFALHDLYFAHFAVTDLAGKRFWYSQKMDRPGPGLGGAETGKIDVRVEDWSVKREGVGHHLKAEGGPYGLDLMVSSPIAPVLHGQKGYSRKGSSPDNASLYYSFPSLGATGCLRVGEEERSVTGHAWMDHEFFTGGLDPTEKGWAWFGLQLSDNSQLMLYLMRDQDGSFHPASAGTVIFPGGKVQHLTLSQVRAVGSGEWKSPHTGARYPLAWDLAIPGLKWKLRVEADLKDQELQTGDSTGVDYWEGSVTVTGTKGEKKVVGEGYLEMTGFDQALKLGKP